MGCEECHRRYDKCQKKESETGESTNAPKEDNESYISFSRISHPVSSYDMYPSIEIKYFFEKSYAGGVYGSSMLIKHKKNRTEFMLKILPKLFLLDNKKTIEEVFFFYEHLKGNTNEYLNPILEISENEEQVFLVSPLSTLGNLSNYLEYRRYNKKDFKITDIKYILNCIVNGLLFLAKDGVLHGNLCFENILLFPIPGTNKFRIKLDDYGHCLYFVALDNEVEIKTYKDDIKSLIKIIEELNKGVHFTEVTELSEYLLHEIKNKEIKAVEVYEKLLQKIEKLENEEDEYSNLRREIIINKK
ncbi:MAG: protein kinase [archaeon]|nr:protein kinase [archaeon]